MALATIACDSDGTTDSGATDSGGEGEVTYADVQAIWDANCAGSGCHTDGGEKGGLTLSEGESYGNLVGVAAVGAAMDLVTTSGNTDDSYLWQKLMGTQTDVGGSGSTMPLGPELTSDQLATVETWILDGAGS
jgi:mono/diheme cytochrome c family protein